MPAVTPQRGYPYQLSSDPPDGADLGEDLALALDSDVAQAYAAINLPNLGRADALAKQTGTGTNSGGYTDIPAGTAGVTSFQFTKRRADTKLFAFMSLVTASDAANTILTCAMLISGTDYEIFQFRHTGAAEYRLGAGINTIAAGLPAGTYTVQGRWGRVSGAGVLSVEDLISWLSMGLMEVLGS